MPRHLVLRKQQAAGHALRRHKFRRQGSNGNKSFEVIGYLFDGGVAGAVRAGAEPRSLSDHCSRF
jgi:hypothetical protein